MTPRQIEAFEQIAVGVALPRAHPTTVDALLRRGVIERGDDKELGSDNFGTISVPQFYVPLPIHMQWCEWCSENAVND